jgi:hypothetical protein
MNAKNWWTTYILTTTYDYEDVNVNVGHNKGWPNFQPKNNTKKSDDRDENHFLVFNHMWNWSPCFKN